MRTFSYFGKFECSEGRILAKNENFPKTIFLRNFLALDVLIPEIATFESARKAHIFGIEIANCAKMLNKSIEND